MHLQLQNLKNLLSSIEKSLVGNSSEAIISNIKVATCIVDDLLALVGVAVPQVAAAEPTLEAVIAKVSSSLVTLATDLQAFLEHVQKPAPMQEASAPAIESEPSTVLSVPEQAVAPESSDSVSS